MRSKNTSTYETQERNFRYTMLAVLGVLIVVAALAFALRTMNDGATPGTQDPLNIGAADSYDGIGGGKLGDSQDIDVSQNVPSGSVPSVDSRDTANDQQNSGGSEPTGSGFVMPIDEAEILKEFSAETPIYSKTLEQYVTHVGTDFEAPSDTQVRAIDGGTVTKVYEDDKLGITIEIDHGKGYVSRYSNLSTMEMVEEGDVVERGQVISGVGNSALFETLDPEHLHFELWKNGQAVDPAEHF